MTTVKSTNTAVRGVPRLLRKLLLTLSVPVVLIVTWQVVTTQLAHFYWPSPAAIAAAFPETWFGERLLDDVVPSLGRLILGYSISVVLGTLLGAAIGSVARLRLFLEPVIELFRAIPPPVLVPVIMLFTGIGANMQVAVIAFGCVWPVLINTIEGVRGVDLTQLDTAKSYRLSRAQLLFAVVLPAASPKIFAGARQALSIGIIMMVISEMFASANGIGFSVIEFQRLFQLTPMWTGILLLGLIGVLANFVFKFVERRALRWYLNMQSQER